MADDKNRTLAILKQTIGATGPTEKQPSATQPQQNISTEELVELPFSDSVLRHLPGILHSLSYFAGESYEGVEEYDVPQNLNDLMNYCCTLLLEKEPNQAGNLISELNVDGDFHGYNTAQNTCDIVHLDLILLHNQTTINLCLSSHPYGKGVRALYNPETDDAEFILGYDPIFASRGFIVTDRVAAMAPENDDYAHLLVQLANGLDLFLDEKSDIDMAGMLSTWGAAIQEIRQEDFSAYQNSPKLPDGAALHSFTNTSLSSDEEAIVLAQLASVGPNRSTVH